MPKMLRVLMVEPHESPHELFITDQLDDLQETVGGLIEVIGNGDGTLLVCNEESKLNGILSDAQYPVAFEYAGQEVATVNITVNDGNPIDNDLIYGEIHGLKIDRETEETIAGAVFGLFRSDETEFTEDTAILTAESGEDGVFTFENVPFGNWQIVELKPAEGFLPNSDIHHVQVSEDGQVIEITAVNDRIPEIGTTATVDGEKKAKTTGIIIIEDKVQYRHLIPGKEYTVSGVLMNKATGEPFTVNGEEIRSEVTFTPETADGEVTVQFSFNADGITKETEVVAFESLYREGVEIAVHADIEDDGQTVTILPPPPEIPQTGDNSNLGFWMGLGAVALGGLVATIIIWIKRKKDDDDE